MDPRKYNGAVFLGLNGVVVKSHGGTDSFGFANAIGVAYDMAKYNFIEDLKKKLSITTKHLFNEFKGSNFINRCWFLSCQKKDI